MEYQVRPATLISLLFIAVSTSRSMWSTVGFSDLLAIVFSSYLIADELIIIQSMHPSSTIYAMADAKQINMYAGTSISLFNPSCRALSDR
eukprot:5537710-Pyramimonas_sp.AAC.1